MSSYKLISFPSVLNQTVSEAKEKIKEGRKKKEKEKDEKDYEKKGTTCRNSSSTATY